MKGHNYGLCRKCGRVHKHPRGTLGKKLKFKDLERRQTMMKNLGIKSRLIPLTNDTKKKFEKMYHNQNLTQQEIAYAFNVSQGTISNYMRRLSIKTKPRFKWEKGHKVWNKGLTKENDDRVRKISNSTLGRPAWNKGSGNRANCNYCGKEHFRPLGRVGKRVFCSRKCYVKYVRKHGSEMVTFPRPNDGELQLLKILKRISTNWQYSGDGELWIGGKNPDFHNGGIHLIELFGGTWHSKVEEKERVKHFEQLGYSCLVIWYSELREPPILEDKVRTWMECD